jgi:hypothetical protein
MLIAGRKNRLLQPVRLSRPNEGPILDPAFLRGDEKQPQILPLHYAQRQDDNS